MFDKSIDYNTRLRSYPDGSLQVCKSSRSYHRAGESEKEYNRLMREDWREFIRSCYPDCPDWVLKLLERKCPYDKLLDIVIANTPAPDQELYSSYRRLYPDCPSWYIYLKSTFVPVEGVNPDYRSTNADRKALDNSKRARQNVYNIAKSNHFDYFVTFTFDPAKVNSFDYDDCVTAVRQWMDINRKKGVQWLIVPEQHESGRFHFHALVAGSLSLTPAVHPQTGMFLLDKSGRMIYNLGDFGFGFTTATEISDPKRTASYLSKYLTKDLVVPKGRKRYWASNSLSRPLDDYSNMDDFAFAALVPQSRFFKDISNEYGNFWLLELEGGSGGYSTK